MPIKSFSFWVDFLRTIRKFDVIKTNQLKAFGMAYLIKIFVHKPLYLRIGYEPLMNRMQKRKNPLLKIIYIYIYSFLAYHLSNVISVPNINIKNFICQKYFIKNSKIKILPNWIDTNLFSPNKKGIKESMNNALFVGRLEDEKNPLLFVEAVINSGLNATIVGKGSLLSQIKKILKERNYDIKLINIIDNEELANLYKSHGFYIITSRYEGQPKSLLEAMSSGCYIISTNVQGINNIISDNKNGLLTQDNANDIVKKIFFLKNNAKLCGEFSREARLYVLNNHSIEMVAELEKNLLNSLC